LAHYGVALNDCMTLSVGFRAPSHQEMIGAYLEALLEQPDEQHRFSDPHRGLPENSAEIEISDIEQLAELLKQQLSNTNLLHDVFGRLVTEPKQPDEFEATEYDKAALLSGDIVIDPNCRLAFIREHYYHVRLFVNGHSLEVTPPAAHLVPRLCEQGQLTVSDYQEIVDTDEFQQLVEFLCQHGVIEDDA
jgi:50S ribosomal protein L16 3-hydroxylase